MIRGVGFVSDNQGYHWWYGNWPFTELEVVISISPIHDVLLMKIFKIIITNIPCLDDPRWLCDTVESNLDIPRVGDGKGKLAQTLSLTALWRPIRWLIKLNKLRTVKLRPHPYWESMLAQEPAT